MKGQAGSTEQVTALVVGAGPAGLMAAERLAGAGHRVVLAEAKPSAARKLLMAGKSGLNITKDEDPSDFLRAYGPASQRMAPMLARFGPAEVRTWAEGLGQDLFTGSSGRVFPTAMKASPLLRAWLVQLAGHGVELRTHWRWDGWEDHAARFGTPEGPRLVRAGVTVLALGGASWSRLGSDGSWTGALAATGVALRPFQPANMGFQVAWSDRMQRHFGAPVKGVELRAGTSVSRGEFVISERGLEGGGIYAVSRAMREGADLRLNLLPDWPARKLRERLDRPRGKQSLSNHLRKALRLDPVRLALLMEFGRPLPEDPSALAKVVVGLQVHHAGPRPIDEAISTAGGICWSSVDDDLALHARRDVFVAGEMLDWEAPTGGYLLTGCLATGSWAGRAAARRLS